MLSKSAYICLLFIFLNAFTQETKVGTDSISSYKRTLADCKTANDSITFYKANASVNIQLLKLRNDSAKTRIMRDTVVVVIDTNRTKPLSYVKQ